MAHLPAQQTMFQRMQESSREQTFSHLLMAWMFICLRKLTSATPVRPTKNTHTISKSCQVLKSGSLHKRRQQECGEQKSMWINHCWLRFVLEHIPRYSSTQARHHCPIRSKMLQWLFPNNFLMAFMFIYVHLKFQYSSMKIERSMILVAPNSYVFFGVKRSWSSNHPWASWGGFQLQSTVSAPAVTTWLRWHGGVVPWLGVGILWMFAIKTHIMYILKIDSQKQDLSNRNCHLQIPMSNSVVYIPFCNSHLHKCFTFFLWTTWKKTAQTTLEILTCKSLGADGSTAIARYKTWLHITDSWCMCYGCAMDFP